MKSGWAAVILIAAGIAAYGNTAKNDLFWDDDEFITRNAYIRSFRYLPEWFSQPLTAGAGVNSNYYRPLLQLSFAIDYKLWGLWPAGYHLENMLWHTTAAILLFIFLTELLRKFEIRNSKFEIAPTVALATAALWLVHPVHVEAVAYANSRGDSMAAAFILLSLIFWLKKRFRTAAAVFALALLSKELAIITPGLILLMEATKNFQFSIFNFQSNSKNQLSKSKFLIIGNLNFIGAWSLKIGFFIAIAAIYVLLRLTALNFQNTLNFYGVDLTKVDQQQPLARYATSLPIRLMTFLKVLPIYAGILIWPSDLYMERTVEIATILSDQTALISLIAVATIVTVAVAILYQGPALLSKAGPLLIIPFAVGWFFISILPVSGLIPISQILAEHFLYLPSIGFFLIFSWVLVSIIRQRIPFLIVFCSLLIPLLSKTISQNRIWRDPITFYEYTLSKTKPTARVYNNLAMAYADVKEHQKAINNYNKAISLGDVYPNPHFNMANTFVEQDKLDEAEREYKRALEIDPNFHYATLKLGQMYINQGKIDDAKKLVCPVFTAQPLCL